MLAPRQTLWSTPPSAMEHLTRWIPLQENDSVCDIGCGDGRIILQWAQHLTSVAPSDNLLSTISFLGIDIDPDRVSQCQVSLAQARQEGKVHPRLQVSFVCANALESTDLWEASSSSTEGNRLVHKDINIFFLYLIPRGLKQIYPLLKQHGQKQEQCNGRSPLQVVTYMAKLPEERPIDRGLCQVDHQPGAEWPLYYYKF